MAAIVVAMIVLAATARRVRLPWAGLVLRLLAVAGFVLPGWTVHRWYRDLAGARDLAASLPLDPGPMVESFVACSAVLLAAGFALLVGGVRLARRLPAGGRGDGPT